MNFEFLRKAMWSLSAATTVAVLLGLGCVAGAAEDKKPPATPKQAPETKAPPRSSGPGGGTRGQNGGDRAPRGPAADGPSAHQRPVDGMRNHGPAANGQGNRGPAAHDGGVPRDTPTNGTRNTPTTGAQPANGRAPFNRGERGAPSNREPGGSLENRGPGGTQFNHSPGGVSPNRGFGNSGHTVFNRPAPRGSNEHITRSGSAIRMRPNGGVSDVHDVRRGIDVHHNLGGGRRVIVDRSDHSRVFAERGRAGYVERGYNFRGHDFDRRSYYYHGHEYNRYYRGFGYRGLSLSVYAPGYYYRPAFYGWAYHPWAAPISFGWGWAGNPWYGHYGYYFRPYPVYAPPVAEGGQPVMTPEIKQMIADEVRNQLALENQEAQLNAQQQDADPASSGIARLLSDGRPHVFVAGGNLDVLDESGHECVVSDGDTLQLRVAPPSEATTADLVVLSSKGKPECEMSLTVQVQLTDLQEMQNHMRETIDQGLKEMQEKQGTGGLPAAPPSAQGQPNTALYASAAPPPEANLGTEIQQQYQQSEQAEKEVTADAPAAAPASVELGQTLDQVQANFGAPARVANLGSKVIYYYDGMKVIFKDGRVSDVE